MNRLHSVGARLSLALLLVVAGALAIVYLALVPTLERNLVDARLAELARSGAVLADRVPGDSSQWQLFVFNNAPAANARVAIVRASFESPVPIVLPQADSSPTGSSDLVSDPIPIEAASTGDPQRGVVTVGEESFAEAAIPVFPGGEVLVLRAPLRNTLENVELVRRRLLVAGLLAFLLSVVVGYGLAALFARRLQRLERAADRIAGGRFDEPVHDPGQDEIGELAAAFDRMRTRLAGLERARREFIANASHELRTPIFSLGGFLELLDDEELDEETRAEFLRTAREQVARLTKLAADLLDLSRLDAGRVQVERESLDLGALAKVLCAEFEAVARSGRHEVETQVDGEPRGVGDEQRTLQIGRILVENALVHTPPGTRVRVTASRRDGRAVLAVEDEGPGIPHRQREHVFERFYRVDGAVAVGSGLGLAIAKELAELMGGTIELESENGTTRFVLALPAAA
jgi:two-component system OmpR family sensor kinase